MDKEDEQIHKVVNVNAILFLYYIEELSVNDISCIEDISQKDVWDVLNKTKETIRNQLNSINLIDSNAFIEWTIIMLMRKMHMNILSEKQSKKIYKNIVCKIKSLS